MIMHIGSDVVVPTKNIIAIINLDIIESAECNIEFLKIAKDEGFIEDAFGDEKPKSLIITDIDGRNAIYMSPISSVTLARRMATDQNIYFDNNYKEVR